MLGSSGVTMGSARGFQALRGLTGVQQGEISDWQSVTVPLCHCATVLLIGINVLGSWAGMPEDILWSRCCLRLAWLGHFEIPMIVSEHDSKTKPR